VLTTTHATDWLDIWAGVDTGVNTSIGRPGDNNDALAGILGFGLNLLDGNLTVLALSHFGPELPRSVPGHNTLMRQEHDVVVTWKINDNLTSTTELNYIRDDGGHATAEGVAQYLTYKLNDQWSVGGRAEVFRDDQGFFVAAFPSSLDFVNAEQGRPNLSISGGRTTYGELTLGVNYKPTMPKPIDSLTIRPEIRFDDALNGTKPFNSQTSSHQVTFGIDAILAF
jgi:hypothetical protein